MNPLLPNRRIFQFGESSSSENPPVRRVFQLYLPVAIIRENADLLANQHRPRRDTQDALRQSLTIGDTNRTSQRFDQVMSATLVFGLYLISCESILYNPRRRAWVWILVVISIRHLNSKESRPRKSAVIYCNDLTWFCYHPALNF